MTHLEQADGCLMREVRLQYSTVQQNTVQYCSGLCDAIQYSCLLLVPHFLVTPVLQAWHMGHVTSAGQFLLELVLGEAKVCTAPALESLNKVYQQYCMQCSAEL